jgi:hypothetical protein
MRPRQHVWLGPEAETYEAECEACLATRESLAAQFVHVEGTLRRDADVGFTTCRRGHRIVLRRIGRSLAAAAR